MSNEILVWYVCYGSNLYLERFMKYINMCSDKTPPRDSKTLTIPYEMYFANESSRWEYKGVCFIKNEKDETVLTYARAYLITKQQFEQVWEKEGKYDEWYGNLIELEPIDGIKAVTFTSKGLRPESLPSTKYYEKVKSGLLECGLSSVQADKYLKAIINGCPLRK